MIQADGKISAQPHTILCIQFLDRENNDKNNTLPLGKQICFTIVWGCAEILPKANSCTFTFAGHQLVKLESWLERERLPCNSQTQSYSQRQFIIVVIVFFFKELYAQLSKRFLRKPCLFNFDMLYHMSMMMWIVIFIAIPVSMLQGKLSVI